MLFASSAGARISAAETTWHIGAAGSAGTVATGTTGGAVSTGDLVDHPSISGRVDIIDFQCQY